MVHSQRLYQVPSISAATGNQELERVLEQSSETEDKDLNQSAKRGQYEFFTHQEKVQIGKLATEHGVAATIRHFSKEFPGRSLEQSSVQTWKMKYMYLQEIALRKRTGKDMVVKEIGAKKSGCPLLLGEELDKRVQAYLVSPCQNGAVINTAIRMACAEGVVKSYDNNLLECNGEHISLT